VYELTLTGGKTGLQPTKEGSCTVYSLDAPPPSAAAARSAVFCGFHLTQNGISRVLDGKGVSMKTLAGNIARSVRRSVIDKTGLTGFASLFVKSPELVPVPQGRSTLR